MQVEVSNSPEHTGLNVRIHLLVHQVECKYSPEEGVYWLGPTPPCKGGSSPLCSLKYTTYSPIVEQPTCFKPINKSMLSKPQYLPLSWNIAKESKKVPTNHYEPLQRPKVRM